jgi:hypothetical protein
MDKDFVDYLKLPLVTKKHPIPVEVIDGRSLVSWDVTHETTPLDIVIEWHHSITTFSSIKSSSNALVLGHFWLDKYYPAIDWKLRRLTFQPSIISIQESGYMKTSSVPGHQQFQSHHGEMSKTHIPLVVGTRAFMRATKKETRFAIYATPIADSVKWPEALPTHYKEYQDVFEKKNADLLPQHYSYNCTIDLQKGTQPPFGPIYNLSQNELAALQEYLDENLAKNFIRHSKSPVGAPILFVKKKDGALRMCVDYRGLNKITIKYWYPLPLISGLLNQLGQAKVYTKIDLRGAYNLVRIKGGDEWKTAFWIRYGHFEYNVMPFGITNAPAIFQHLMNDIFREFLDDFMVNYLDDILIFSKDEKDYEKHVRMVLQKLQDARFYAKLEKCIFHQPQVEFLGYIIFGEGLSKDPKKI